MMKPCHLIIAGVTLLAGCTAGPLKSTGTPLPDAGSPEALAYEGRCGTCHAVPHPRRLTYRAWQDLLPVMERRMKERRMEPLASGDRKAILSYLERNGR